MMRPCSGYDSRHSAARWTHKEPPFIGELPQTRQLCVVQQDAMSYLRALEGHSYTATLRWLDELVYVTLIKYAQDLLSGRIGYNAPYPVKEYGYNFQAVYQFHVRHNMGNFAAKFLIVLACSASLYMAQDSSMPAVIFAILCSVGWGLYASVRRRIRQKRQEPFVMISASLMDLYRAIGDAWFDTASRVQKVKNAESSSVASDEQHSALERLEHYLDQLQKLGGPCPEGVQELLTHAKTAKSAHVSSNTARET